MAVLAVGLSSMASAQTASTDVTRTYVPNQVLVKFKTSAQSVSRIAHTAIGARVVRELPKIGVQTVRIPAGWTVTRALQYYKRLPSVQYAEANYYAKATATVNDPLYSQQWWLEKVGAPAAWDLSMGDSGIKIAIVDTGVDYTHEDLKGKIELGHDYIQDDNDPMDVQGHGTHCAGIAAAQTNNGVGTAGLGYGCSIVAIRVLGDDGSGAWDGIAAGILNAVEHNSDVISLSLGGYFNSSAVADAVTSAWNSGSVLVAGAGNDNVTDVFYPAGYQLAIAVAATDSTDSKSDFSNYDPSWVDVAAPGSGILSTVMGNSYESWDGTSMATPVVAGLAGLMKTYNPSATNQEIRDAIESTTVNVGTFVKYGRINAPAAIAAIELPVQFEGDPTDVSMFTGLGSTFLGTVDDVVTTDSVGATVSAARTANVGWQAATVSPVTGFDSARFIRGTLTIRHKSIAAATTSVFLRNYAKDALYPSAAPHYDLVKSAPGSSSYTTTSITLTKSTIANYLNSSNEFEVVVRSNVPVRLSRTVSGYSLSVDRIVVNADLKKTS